MEKIPKTSPISSEDPGAAEGTSEGARRATGGSPSAGGRKPFIVSAPDPEVPEKKPRRKFTAKYKLCILAEADADQRFDECDH